MKTITRKRQQQRLNIFYASLAVALGMIILYVILVSKRAPKANPVPVKSAIPTISIALSAVPTLNLEETISWKTYHNNKFGFSLKYPETLDLAAREISAFGDSALYRQYLDGCCGDMRSPEWIISLENQRDGKIAAKIFVFEKPIAHVIAVEGVEKTGFTFGVYSGAEFHRNTLQYIDLSPHQTNLMRKTFKFTEPERPLGCLWDLDRGAGFYPDDEYTKTLDKNILVLLKGFYYDKKSSTCMSTSFYEYRDQTDYAIPFQTLTQCEEACLR